MKLDFLELVLIAWILVDNWLLSRAVRRLEDTVWQIKIRSEMIP